MGDIPKINLYVYIIYRYMYKIRCLKIKNLSGSLYMAQSVVFKSNQNYRRVCTRHVAFICPTGEDNLYNAYNYASQKTERNYVKGGTNLTFEKGLGQAYSGLLSLNLLYDLLLNVIFSTKNSPSKSLLKEKATKSAITRVLIRYSLNLSFRCHELNSSRFI